jgi:hypothetical protein
MALRGRGVALEAVDMHAGVGVTALTELARCIDGYRSAVLVIAAVAVYTLDETEFLGTYTFVHGFVTLV